MIHLQSAPLNLCPCPRFTAIQENGHGGCDAHPFSLKSLFWAGPCILKTGEMRPVQERFGHLSLYSLTREERFQVFKRTGDQQLFARELMQAVSWVVQTP
eukprot:358210-Chlamydomonas_euryale.AAC.5